MRLKKGELSLPINRSTVSDLWEFIHLSVSDENQKILFGTDESIGVAPVPESFLKHFVEISKKNPVPLTIEEAEFNVFCLQSQH